MTTVVSNAQTAPTPARRGYTAEQINQVRRAYKAIYRESLSLEDATAKLVDMATDSPEIQPLVDFLKTAERGIIR